MRLLTVIAGVIVGAVIGMFVEAQLLPSYVHTHCIPLLLSMVIGAFIAALIPTLIHARSAARRLNLEHLPLSASQFINLIIKRMRYRRKVRVDVAAELAAHFEDALKDCKTDDERNQMAKKLIADFGDVKLLGILLRRAKKRCRPLWRTIVARTFQTIGALILCFILYCVYVSLGEPTISINYIEQATRLARPVVDEGLNAAPLYQKAIDAYKKEPEIQIEREFPVRSSPRSKHKPKDPSQKIVQTVDLLEAIDVEDWITDLNEKELSLLQQWIASNTEALEYFREAAEKPHCWWHRQAKDNIVIAALIPELADLRRLTQLICWQAKLEAYNGDTEAAFDDLLFCYKIGMHYKGPRSLIEQLVGIAIQSFAVRSGFVILSNKQIDDTLLKDFQDELEVLMGRDFHTMDYKVESFMGLDFIQRCYTDNGHGSGHLIPGRVKEYWQLIDQHDTYKPFAQYARSLAMSLTGADRRDMSRALENVYRTGEKWARKTPWQLKKENVDTEMGMDEWSDFRRARYWPLTVLAPAMAKASELSYWAKAQIEALVTTLAATRYKRAHGDYPENLDRLLEADLLKKLPMDPYSDQPLVYRTTDGDFILYSVGPNFKDDGGQVVPDGRGRVTQWADEGDVLFWPLETYQQRQERLEMEHKRERRVLRR